MVTFYFFITRAANFQNSKCSTPKNTYVFTECDTMKYSVRVNVRCGEGKTEYEFGRALTSALDGVRLRVVHAEGSRVRSRLKPIGCLYIDVK